MGRPADEPKTFEAACEVWEYLTHRRPRRQHCGGLDPNDRDKDLTDDIRATLGLPRSGDIGVLLKTHTIPADRFIVALFTATKPYAEMLTGLLAFFEKAGASVGNDNILVTFQFDEDLPELEFDLNHFRRMVESWRRVIGEYTVRAWGYQQLWDVCSALGGGHVAADVRGCEAWVGEYLSSLRWPSIMPGRPHSAFSDLDEQLARVFSLWRTVVEESRRYGDTLGELREAGQRWVELHRNDTRAAEPADAGWNPSVLARVNSDHWTASVLNGSCEVAAIEDAIQASEVAHRLRDLFDAQPTREVTGEFLARSLTEFLDLPVWRHRHELYSMWVGTQLVAALGQDNTHIHVINGVLRIAFSGTHLATSTVNGRRLHLFAELRSGLANPVGKSRKRRIQPDYSLLSEPITAAGASVLEVECKQYKRVSTRNFADALTDYARGRPNASVILVNYGPGDDTVVDGVDDALRSRCHLVGTMRPGYPDCIAGFSALVRSALPPPSSMPTPRPTASRPTTVNGATITLTWKSNPRDLDLHLFIGGQPTAEHVSYRSKGLPGGTHEAWLETDVQSGWGPETITIERLGPRKYHCLVYNYSNDGDVADCGATVRLSLGSRAVIIPCPEDGSGRCWSVFTLDGETAELTVTNSIRDGDVEAVFGSVTAGRPR